MKIIPQYYDSILMRTQKMIHFLKLEFLKTWSPQLLVESRIDSYIKKY